MWLKSSVVCTIVHSPFFFLTKQVSGRYHYFQNLFSSALRHFLPPKSHFRNMKGTLLQLISQNFSEIFPSAGPSNFPSMANKSGGGVWPPTFCAYHCRHENGFRFWIQHVTRLMVCIQFSLILEGCQGQGWTALYCVSTFLAQVPKVSQPYIKSFLMHTLTCLNTNQNNNNLFIS